ncbi:MAG: methanogenesis marker 3 protein [Methanosarcinales archaeon]|jgi:putative methanogenesis marker protein 3|nr:methanogenesis marker 3 protein [Methanosarcinales archaeon]
MKKMAASKISVTVNGTVHSFKKNITPAEVIEETGVPYAVGASICIVKKQKDEAAAQTKEYVLQTSKGPLVIELKDPSSLSSQLWIKMFEKSASLPVFMESADALSFGPFRAEFDFVRGSKRYRKYDIVFSAGGFDTSKTTLIISKKDHYAEYGVPEDGVFAALIAGRTNLEKIDKGDIIESVTPYIEEKEAYGDGYCTADLSVPLKDGDRLITAAEIEISPHSPQGAEAFFAVIKDGTFRIDSAANAFRADDTLQGEPCEYENFEPRKIGAVCLRTARTGRGRAFISTANRASSLLHSVVGRVTSGMELAYFAKSGDKFTVETSPPRLLLLGHNLEESRELLDALGIKMKISGFDGSGNIIVAQSPATTIEILRAGEVTVTTVPKSKLIEVEFYYDEAPKSVEFFRHSIDLKTQPVGSLPVSMVYDETFIFKAAKQAEKYKEIMPENTPKGSVKAYDIGITNQSAKRMGYIGVRLADETMFGPTGEKFEATNIIGRVLNPENLKNISEGDTIYIQEINARKEGGDFGPEDEKEAKE